VQSIVYTNVQLKNTWHTKWNLATVEKNDEEGEVELCVAKEKKKRERERERERKRERESEREKERERKRERERDRATRCAKECQIPSILLYVVVAQLSYCLNQTYLTCVIKN
jgi:hypothetical protein